MERFLEYRYPLDTYITEFLESHDGAIYEASKVYP